MRKNENTAQKGPAKIFTSTPDNLAEIHASFSEIRGKVHLLEARIALLEAESPFHASEPDQPSRGKAPKISDLELFHTRDAYILGLEQVWPKIAKKVTSARTKDQLATLLKEFADKIPMRDQLRERFVGATDELFTFLSDTRYKKRPSDRAVRLALNWNEKNDSPSAAAKLPTRQIANAIAGVPELKWRSSLDRCGANPSRLRVGLATEDYYRRMVQSQEGPIK